jgi:hypothetical protein
VLVNVIANLVAAAIVFLFGALVGWFPRDRVLPVAFGLTVLLLIVGGGVLRQMSGGDRVRRSLFTAMIRLGPTLVTGSILWWMLTTPAAEYMAGPAVTLILAGLFLWSFLAMAGALLASVRYERVTRPFS